MRLAVLILLSTALLRGEDADMGRPPSYRDGRAVPSRSSSLLLNPPASWIDTASRSGVAAAYLNVLPPTAAVLPGWVGNVTNGDAGSTTQAYKNAVLARVNFFRQMAGVPTPITFTASYSADAQQAALLMSANGQLSDSPPSYWLFFSQAGADGASHSNLCLEFPYLNDPGCVKKYIEDYEATNFDVGHRRWILFPQTQNMGSGDVQPPYPQLFASALWVKDTHNQDARPATRDPYVAWPPKGNIPYQLVPGRWSFSYPNADFTNAAVTMQRGGGPVIVRLETPRQNLGENSVVWVPDNIDPSVSTSWPVPVADTPITVTVSHVMVNGVDTSFTYTVIVIDPSTGLTIAGHVTLQGSPLAGVNLSLSGGSTASTDGTGAYSFVALTPGTYSVVPALAGYAFTPPSRSVSALTATADFTAALCDFSAVSGNLTLPARSGSGTYTASVSAGCAWTASSTASWLVTSASGAGPVSISYTFSTNNGTARTAALIVAGRTVTFTQPSAGQSLVGPVNVGTFHSGIWALDANGNGVFDAGDKYFSFQIYGPGDVAIKGDWNGDGRTKTGIWNNGFWALDYNGNGRWDGPVIDRFIALGGNPGEVPIVGDWNGDGRTKVGYYNRGFWALDYNGNGQWDGAVVDRFIALGGNPGEVPLVGDWNGDGRSKVGYYLRGLWALDYNGNGLWDGPVVDRYTVFSIGTGETPIVGDWSGSGTTKIGVWKNGFFSLDTNGSGRYEAGQDTFIALGGNPGEVPLVGDWNGDGKSKVGYFLNGFWALDYNGNGTWDGTGPGKDRLVALGGNPGEQPVTGKW